VLNVGGSASTTERANSETRSSFTHRTLSAEVSAEVLARLS